MNKTNFHGSLFRTNSSLNIPTYMYQILLLSHSFRDLTYLTIMDAEHILTKKTLPRDVILKMNAMYVWHHPHSSVAQKGRT